MKGFAHTEDVIDRIELAVALLMVSAVAIGVMATALGWGIPFLCQRLPVDATETICSPTPASSAFVPGLITATLNLTTGQGSSAVPRPVATAAGQGQATPVPLTGDAPHFGSLSFCLQAGLDKASQHCTLSGVAFTGCVQTIYASWPYSHVYAGLTFGRRWYRDGDATPIPGQAYADIWDGIRWRLDGSSEFTWLNASSLYARCLPAGSYRVELYIQNSLEQSAGFNVDG